MNARGSRVVSSAALVAGCLFARVAACEESTYHESVYVAPRSRWITMPLEVGHSTAWTHQRTGPLYEFDSALLPGLLVADRLGFHLGGELHYRNPGWDGGPAARVDCVLTQLAGGFVPVRVLAGANWLAHANAFRLEGGLGAGLGKLLTLTLSGGYETDREVKFLHLGLGIDLYELSDPVAGITHYVPQETH